MCPCGEAEQNTEHFLQTYKLHLAQRQRYGTNQHHKGKTVWISGGPTEDRQICCGDWHSSVKANYKKKIIFGPLLTLGQNENSKNLLRICKTCPIRF